MPTSRTITRIEIDWDESTCMLMLEFEGDGYVNWYALDGVDLDAFYDQVKARIGPYLQERDNARAEYVVAVREDGSYRVEPDEDAYDPTDPKHPTYHERMSSWADERDDWPMTEGPTGIAGFKSGRYV